MTNLHQTMNVRVTDEMVDELIEIVTGWTGETGTDYMAVTVQVREALARAETPPHLCENCGWDPEVGGTP